MAIPIVPLSFLPSIVPLLGRIAAVFYFVVQIRLSRLVAGLYCLRLKVKRSALCFDQRLSIGLIALFSHLGGRATCMFAATIADTSLLQGVLHRFVKNHPRLDWWTKRLVGPGLGLLGQHRPTHNNSLKACMHIIRQSMV